MDIVSYLLGKNASGGGGGSDLDWTALGYSSQPQHVTDTYNEISQMYEKINNDYNYAKNIMDNWIPEQDLTGKFQSNSDLVYMPLVNTNITTNMTRTFQTCTKLSQIALLDTSNVNTMYRCFYTCSSLLEIPKINTSKVENFQQCFMSCSSLTTLPILDFSKAQSNTSLSGTFSNCTKLTDESLDNVLQSCITATSYTGTKTLAQIGFGSGFYPATRIQALPHYQDFIDAGWTIGY